MHVRILILLLIVFCSQNVFANIFDLLFPDREKLTSSSQQIINVDELQTIIPLLEIPAKSNSDSASNYLNWAVQTAIKYSTNLDSENNNAIFFKYDLNSDGEDDIIFNGNIGPPEDVIFIWQNVGGKYKFICTYRGNVESFLKNENSNLLSVIIVSENCCASYVNEISVVSPKLKENIISFNLSERFKNFIALEYPIGTKIITPIKFSTLNENYRMRSKPSIDDTLYQNSIAFESATIPGNIISEFNVGSTGVAIASFTDEDNRIWWLVKMDVNMKTSYNLFYNDEGAHKCGWMSSKYLKCFL